MTASRRSVRRLGAALAAAALAACEPGPATRAAPGAAQLPGGTTLEIALTSPADGALVASPPGEVTLSGTASVGGGAPSPDTLVVFVVDVSGSTSASAACAPATTIRGCEVEASVRVARQAATAGTVGQIGVVVFAGDPDAEPDAAAADMSPEPGRQPIAGAAAASSPPETDVERVLRSVGEGTVDLFAALDVGWHRTNFAAGLAEAVAVAGASDRTRTLVIFMSDGGNNAGEPVSAVAVPPGVVIRTFALAGATCANDPFGLGSLADVSARGAPGSGCTPVPTLADLPSVLPEALAPRLLSLSLAVDGGVPLDLPAAPPLPAAGPASVAFAHALSGLLPGRHALCVAAAGEDPGGAGTATACAQVAAAGVALAPPESASALSPGARHQVTAAVAAGPDGGVAGVPLEFAVLSGPNAGRSARATTDAAGEARFGYDARQGPAGLGTDVIQACFADAAGVTACASASKTWRDGTAPAAWCTPGPNPAGRVPASGGGAAQRPDGFYRPAAEDEVDPSPQVFLRDLGSGTVFGPFPSGTAVKYVQAPGAPPGIEEMAGGGGAVAWLVKGRGDAEVFGRDAAGNESAPAACRVPPRPR